MKEIPRNQRGATLPELLVAVAVGMIGIAATYELFDRMNEVRRNVERTVELEQLRRTIQISLDCGVTINQVPAVCSQGTRIPLYRGEDDLLVSIPADDTYSRIGDEFVQASCGSRREVFRVQVAWAKAEGCNPPSDATCWKNLFEMPIGCP